LFDVDTSLSIDAAFSNHLVVRTPVEDAPLDWASDDTDTENLISTAEELISAQAQGNVRPCFAMPAGEGQASGDDDSTAARPTEELEGDTDGRAESVTRLSVHDLDTEEFDGGLVFKLSPQALDSLLKSPHQLAVRQRSEPVASAAGSGDATKLEHQASAPANLEGVSVSVNQESNAVVYEEPVISDVPSTCHLPAANLEHQSVTGSVSNAASLGPSQGGDEAVGSSATHSGFPSESSLPPASENTACHQPPETWQGARPKDPPAVDPVTSWIPAVDPVSSWIPAVDPVTSWIPIFVEEEMLSEDEDDKVDIDREKCDKSSTVIVSLSASVLQMINESVSSLAGTARTQSPSASNSTGEKPVLGDVGTLAELDLRNNDESVSTSN